MSEESRVNQSAKDLNIVLKELRRSQLCSSEEAALRKQIEKLNTEIVKLKTTLTVSATAVVVVWAIFGSIFYGEVKDFQANSKAIISHDYLIKSLERQLNRNHRGQ